MLTTDDLRKIHWKCRRGMLELDFLLLNYFNRYYETLPEVQKRVFSRFLDRNDVELADWLIHRMLPKQPEFIQLVDQILSINEIDP